MCLHKTDSKVHIGKNLPDAFPIQNGLKWGDALSPLFFNSVLECTIRGPKNPGVTATEQACQLLVYADDVNLLSKNIHTTKKHKSSMRNLLEMKSWGKHSICSCLNTRTDWPMHAMVQNPSWEANNHSANQEIFHLLWNSRVHYHVHKTLSWARWIHSTTSRPISLRSILILSSHLWLGLPHDVIIRIWDKIIAQRENKYMLQKCGSSNTWE